MTDAERIARLEAELEQCRKVFAHERSQLENRLAHETRKRVCSQCSSEAAKSAEYKVCPCGRVLPAGGDQFRMATAGGMVDICADCYTARGPVMPPAAVAPAQIRRCVQCDSQVHGNHWALNGTYRCSLCGPFRALAKCPDCGAPNPAGEGCSWCGPGANKP